MMKKKSFIIQLGLAMLMVSVFCLVPVLANTVDGTTLETKMIADKMEYMPGDYISYTFGWDFTSTVKDVEGINYCDHSEFILDPNIESITQNNPEYCSIKGNVVTCVGHTLLWHMGKDSHLMLPVWSLTGPTNDMFTVSGKIRDGTSLGTIIRSTASYECILENPFIPEIRYITDTSESTVWVKKPVPACLTANSCDAPEFPSTLIPVSLIIGFLGAVLLISRTREH
jgi:hypothetical protein